MYTYIYICIDTPYILHILSISAWLQVVYLHRALGSVAKALARSALAVHDSDEPWSKFL